MSDIRLVFCSDSSSLVGFSKTEEAPFSCNQTRALVICSAQFLESVRQITSVIWSVSLEWFLRMNNKKLPCSTEQHVWADIR